jgi:hypothetical protein
MAARLEAGAPRRTSDHVQTRPNLFVGLAVAAVAAIATLAAGSSSGPDSSDTLRLRGGA